MKRLLSILIIFLTFFMVSAGEQEEIRDCLEEWNLRNIGIREETGHNDGAFIEYVQKLCNTAVGNSYCACYVNAGFRHCGLEEKDLPWCPAWTPCWERTEYTIYVRGKRGSPKEWLKGDVFLLYYEHLARVGHAGYIGQVYPNRGYVITYEGNTSDIGNQWNPGQGIHAKKRKIDQIYKVVDYITPYTQKNCKPMFHRINKKETLYRISLMYKISIQDIRDWNPQIENDIVHLGEQLRVNEC